MRCSRVLYYALRHIPSSLYPVEYEFRRILNWFSVRLRENPDSLAVTCFSIDKETVPEVVSQLCLVPP